MDSIIKNQNEIKIGEEGGNPWASSDRLFRQEADIKNCVVDGQIPTNLEGIFYRVGPDPIEPLLPQNIPFDGEGHASMFRIKDGRVDYRSRFIRTERYVAQEEAGRVLFPMYRNPSLDDPSVKGLSRSTANTHIVPFGDYMLALKEDSAPTALDPFTLETKVANFTFGDTLPSKTFTAHPKYDSHTGNLVAFGYESEGDGSDVISIFEYTMQGELVWSVKIKAPYVSLLHDIAVTENFVAFFIQPLTLDNNQMNNGGIRYSWEASQCTYFGSVRRGGDGSDLRWVKGSTNGMFHIMGAFDDNNRIYVDASVSKGCLLPFLPHKKDSQWNPNDGTAFLNRISMNVSGKTPSSFKMESLYPTIGGELPRQDDRYNTVPYRYGFQGSHDPEKGNIDFSFTRYTRFDHHTGKVMHYEAEPGVNLTECVFAPKNDNAAEGEGYLLGVATHIDKGGLADLLILDAEHLDEGPIAKVKMPTAIAGQIHSWWTPEWKLPKNNNIN